MNVLMYDEVYSHVVSYFSIKAPRFKYSKGASVKERHSVNHLVKKVLLHTTIRLPSYIKINIKNAYYFSRIDGCSTLD